MEQHQIALAEGAYQTLNNLVTLLSEWLDKDMPVVLAISGGLGVGKSTLGMQVGKRYLEKKGEKLDVDKHIAYTFDQIIDRINTLPEYSLLIIDEAVNVMMSEDWARFESKYLKKVFAKLRVKHLLIILCIPNFWWLDRKYREDMVSFWVHVYSRGKGAIFIPMLNIGCEDKWNRKMFEKKMTRRISYFTPSSDIERMIVKHNCFFDFIAFPKMDAEVYDKYKVRRMQAITEMEKLKQHRFYAPLADVMKAVEMIHAGKSPPLVGKELGYSGVTVRGWYAEAYPNEKLDFRTSNNESE